MESPKKRFLKNEEKSKQYAGIAHSKLFEEACDVALLEMVHRQGSQVVDVHGVEAIKLKGAKEFQAILEKLGDSEPELVNQRRGLDYSH